MDIRLNFIYFIYYIRYALQLFKYTYFYTYIYETKQIKKVSL